MQARMKDIYMKWLRLRAYLSAGNNLYINPEHSSNVTHFEKLFSILPKISPKHVVIYNKSGRWSFQQHHDNDGGGGVLSLYASPFDVIVHHNKRESSHSSIIWMKDIIYELIKVIDPGVDVSWKYHDENVDDEELVME